MNQFNTLLLCILLVLWTPLASAVQPYISGDKVQGGDLKSVMAQVEKKLASAGFNVVGHHTPSGLAQHGSLVVTDQAMLDVVLSAGGQTIVGAGIRIGVKADGSVSYMNPDYWYRAYLRKQFASAEGAVKTVQDRLAKALGAGKPFGGEVSAEDLPSYRYMWGMERFDDFKNELRVFASFDEAVKIIRDNLARQVGNTAKVYEIVTAEKKLAVFGVAMNDPKTGEGWWVNKVGPDHVAALPWEIYVVGNKAGAMQGRYRTALSWPSLSMGTFMGISDHPDATHDTLRLVAGGTKN